MDSKIKNKPNLEYAPILLGELSEDTLEAFMKGRLEYLIQYSTVKRVGGSTSCQDLIGPEVPIVSEGEISKDFFLDDDSIYDGLAARVVNLFEQVTMRNPDLTKDEVYFTAVMHAVLRQQIHYFDKTISGNRNLRGLMLGDFIDSEFDQESFSINELKQVAMCMERAVVSHNMLKSLGVDSTLEVGDLVDAKGVKGGHAWVVVEGPDGESRIFDPLNCHLQKDAAGNYVDVKPLVQVFSGTREPVAAERIIHGPDSNVIATYPMRYEFASEESLAFARNNLSR